MIQLNEEQLDKYRKEQIEKHWKERDVTAIFSYMRNSACINYVYDNLARFNEIGKYEEALLEAYQETWFNYSHYNKYFLRFLFRIADPDKLRLAGDPIPKCDSVILYRGISGRGSARRVSGISWTKSLNVAAWFAYHHFDWEYFENPTVYKIKVDPKYIIAALDGRDEKECLLLPPLPVKPRKVNCNVKNLFLIKEKKIREQEKKFLKLKKLELKRHKPK